MPRRWRDAGSRRTAGQRSGEHDWASSNMPRSRPALRAELRDELEAVLVVFLTEEQLLSAVSPLGDMVGHARSYHTCQSSHGGKLTRPQPPVKSYAWCPRNSLVSLELPRPPPSRGIRASHRLACSRHARMPETAGHRRPEPPFFIAFQRPSVFHKLADRLNGGTHRTLIPKALRLEGPRFG